MNCSICGKLAGQDHECLVRLPAPEPCTVCASCGFTSLAYWRLNGVPLCDEEITRIAEMNSDNEEWLKEALADIRKRIEQRERRRLFISMARRPEMRRIVQALRFLDWDKGVEWRDVTELDVKPPQWFQAYWMLVTDKWLIIDYTPDADEPNFSAYELEIDAA